MEKRHSAAQQTLRRHLLELLAGESAHLPLERAAQKFPVELRGKKHPKLPYTAWQLLEHMRLAQQDIVSYCRNTGYQPLDWPDDYWPEAGAPPARGSWAASLKQYAADRAEIIGFIGRPERDLLEPLYEGTNHSLAREALVLAQHTSYHVGQFAMLKRLLGLEV